MDNASFHELAMHTKGGNREGKTWGHSLIQPKPTLSFLPTLANIFAYSLAYIIDV